MRNLLLLTALAVIFLTFVNGEELLGAQKCTWGPSYWCQGIRESSQCSATKHCIRKYWNSNPYPEDDDDVCKICKEMVKEARDQLESNQTQEELKEVFEGSCQLIPIKIIREECITLSDEFVVELVETLASEMNPDTVCSVAGLCNSKKIDNLLAMYKDPLNLHKKSDCQLCKEESRKLSTQIVHADKDLVLDKILELCGNAGSYSDACRTMVMEDFDDIYNVLIHLDDGLCEISGMCPGPVQSVSVPNSNGGDVQCEFCEKVIQHWIDTWTSNTTQEEFKTVLEALCHKMKPSRQQHCLHIVDDYYIPWFNWILHELNPKTTCTLMGLCSNGQFLETNSNMPISLLLTSEEENQAIDVDSSDQLIGGYFSPEVVEVMDKPGCIMCEYVIHKVQHFLSDNKTEEEIEHALEQVCGYMPKAVKPQCEHVVETYGTAIIEMLANGVDPKEICTMMHLCDQQAELLLLTQVPQDNPIMEMRKANDNCAICQYAMETLYTILENKDNQDEIRNTLDTLCEYMPSSISKQCEEYVDAYAETVIQLILQDFTPQQICAEIGLCSSVSEVVMTVQDTKCVLCEYVIKTLDDLLANNATEAEIKVALEEVCDYLPGSVKKQCTQFVDMYSDMIVDFLTHQMSPEEVCQQLGLCPGQIESNAEQFQMLAQVDEIIQQDNIISVSGQENENDRPYCTLCEYAIGEVDKLITDKKNEEQIKSALDRICYELSNPMKDKCLEMVNTYTDEIIDMFIAEYTPQEVCAQLGLCDEPKIQIQQNNIPQEINNSVDDGICILCEYAMKILETEIINNRTMDMVEHSVLMLCSYLPGTISDKCIDFVQTYGDEIIDQIVHEEMDPKQVCTALTLCGSQTWDASPLGGRQCAWGPAFWCQSKIHARACGTTQHCEEHVWNKNY